MNLKQTNKENTLANNSDNSFDICHENQTSAGWLYYFHVSSCNKFKWLAMCSVVKI